MSWGTDLWDQTDNVAAHLQKGIEFCEKFSHFLKEKCALETEYATKLKRLVKSYQPRKKDEDCEYTCVKSFQDILSEVIDVAGQHECIVEGIMSKTMKSLQLLVQQLKNDRKRYLQDNAKQNSNMQSYWVQLDKVKKLYERAFRDAEKAQEQYVKADADIHLSRAEVEKARVTMTQKQQVCENAKSDYAAELKKANNYQREHFDRLLPDIMQNLQTVEENRLKSMKELYLECIETEQKVIPIINTCMVGMAKAASLVSPSSDIVVVIEKYKSGFLPPGDIPFEDLRVGDGIERVSPTGSVQSLSRVESTKTKPAPAIKTKKKGILGIFGGSKNEEVKEDFSHLPPSQQKKKLVQQINTIKAAITKETAERDGLMKMQDVYSKNPSLGDPQSLAKQLEESSLKLDQLHSDMHKFQMYLAEVDGTSPRQESWSTSSQSLPHLNSSDDRKSVKSSGKDEPQIPNAADIPDLNFNGSNMSLELPDYMTSKDNLSTGSVDSFDGPDADDEADASSHSHPTAAVFGTCTALYEFTALNDQSLSMTEGEKFTIMEKDQGDGWMRVKNSSGIEGFVPASYMDCQ